MLSLFKKQTGISAFILLLLSFVFNLNILFSDQLMIQLYKNAPLSSFINDFAFTNVNENVLFIIYCFALYFFALAFNSVMYNLKLTSKDSHIPALLFITLFSLFNQHLYYSAIFYSIILLLLFINNLYQLSDKIDLVGKAFNIGFITALLIFVFAPFYVLILLFFVGMFLFSAFNLKPVLAYFIGFVVPFIYYVAFLFFYDNAISFQFLEPQFSLPIFGSNQNFDFAKLTFVSVITLFAFLFSKKEQNNALNGKLKLLNFALLILLLSIAFINPKCETEVLILCLIPLTIYLSRYILNTKKPKLVNVLYLVLVVCLVVFQWFV